MMDALFKVVRTCEGGHLSFLTLFENWLNICPNEVGHLCFIKNGRAKQPLIFENIHHHFSTSQKFQSMKKLFFVSMTVGLLLAGGCQKTETINPVNLESNEMRNFLVSELGLPTEKIEETADAFIVEGDMIFEKADFWNDYETDHADHNPDAATDRQHRKHTYKVTKTNKITVNIKPDVPQTWRNAIGSAIQKWNQLYGELTFEIMYGANYNDIPTCVNVSMMNLSGRVAQALYPKSDGYPGAKMYINPNYNNLYSTYKIFVMVHELGHSIGFRHTDSTEGSAIVTGEPICDSEQDPLSAMRDIIAPWTGFTDCDVYAYYTLYPD